MVDFVKVEYLLRHNPLGIEDRMALRIRTYRSGDFRHLHDFYIKVMAIFRYKYYSDNQLAFDFSGRHPVDKYTTEWSSQFKKWVKAFCEHHTFLRAVLDLTVFYPPDSPVLLMDTRMQTFVTHFFELKIHPQKGIIRRHVA
jgi:hypothetical protein